MNKLVFTVLGITTIIAGAFAYVLLKPSSEPTPPSSNTTPPAPEPTPPIPSAPEPQVSPGAYIDYSAEGFASASGTRLLFFYASWCPQCRQLDADIKRGGVPDNVTVLKVDYDSNQALRQKYGVTIQTTVVKVDASGNKVASYVAYDEPAFSVVKRELLP